MSFCIRNNSAPNNAAHWGTLICNALREHTDEVKENQEKCTDLILENQIAGFQQSNQRQETLTESVLRSQAGMEERLVKAMQHTVQKETRRALDQYAYNNVDFAANFTEKLCNNAVKSPERSRDYARSVLERVNQRDRFVKEKEAASHSSLKGMDFPTSGDNSVKAKDVQSIDRAVVMKPDATSTESGRIASTKPKVSDLFPSNLSAHINLYHSVASLMPQTDSLYDTQDRTREPLQVGAKSLEFEWAVASLVVLNLSEAQLKDETSGICAFLSASEEELGEIPWQDRSEQLGKLCSMLISRKLDANSLSIVFDIISTKRFELGLSFQLAANQTQMVDMGCRTLTCLHLAYYRRARRGDVVAKLKSQLHGLINASL